MADTGEGEEGKQPELPVDGGGDAGNGGDSIDWKAEAEKHKALWKKKEAEAIAGSAAIKKLAAIEESQKTETQKLSEARQAAETEAADAKRDLARLRVALRRGLTEAQAKRLVGDTEEDLEKDADDLLATFTKQDSNNGAQTSPSSRPRERLRSGSTPGKEPEETDPVKLAAAVPR